MGELHPECIEQGPFAAFLVDSYNRRTGRCDPSEETAAHLLGVSTRTIVRAGKRLTSAKFFTKRRHAGQNHCNSYEPNWYAFRCMERDYALKRQKWRARFEKAALSSTQGQQCQPESDIVGLASRQGSPSHSDNSVTQTSPINPIPKTSPSNSITSTLAAPPSNCRLTPENETRLCREEKKATESAHQAVKTNSARLAWEAAATRRWNDDLRYRFKSPRAYGFVVDAIDFVIQVGATEAEMKRTGGGIEFIIEELVRRGVLEQS